MSVAKLLNTAFKQYVTRNNLNTVVIFVYCPLRVDISYHRSLKHILIRIKEHHRQTLWFFNYVILKTRWKMNTHFRRNMRSLKYLVSRFNNTRKYTRKCSQYLWVRERLLFNANSALFELYRGENKLIFNE